eukprot:scaffold376_cov156-Amphora_coffeaeformis.AAC.9
MRAHNAAFHRKHSASFSLADILRCAAAILGPFHALGSTAVSPKYCNTALSRLALVGAAVWFNLAARAAVRSAASCSTNLALAIAAACCVSARVPGTAEKAAASAGISLRSFTTVTMGASKAILPDPKSNMMVSSPISCLSLCNRSFNWSTADNSTSLR